MSLNMLSRFPPPIIQHAIWIYLRFSAEFETPYGVKEPVQFPYNSQLAAPFV
jgi:hypothetical protein